MKQKLTYATLAVAAMILTGFLMDRREVVWSQEVGKAVASEDGFEGLTVVVNHTEEGPDFEVAQRAMRRSLDSIIRKAVQSYQAAKDDAKKKQAKETVSSALIKYFEADMKQREQDIQAIEERVKKLRDQLEKRRAAKEEIIGLQLQVVINEAEGMGFYGGRSVEEGFGRSGFRRRGRATFDNEDR